MIKYHKGDLFELAPKGSILAHAVNCQGVWSKGIAKTFKEKFPESYKDYQIECRIYADRSPLGRLSVFDENGYRVVSLHTSRDYGKNVDKPHEILISTYMCMVALSHSQLYKEIWLPKINSGLFKVPWEWTESVLNRFPNTIFNVCELEK